MESDRDKSEESVGALDVAADSKGETRRGSRPAVGSAGPAPPRVVQLGGAEDEPEDPNDKSERPDIRLTGAPGAAATPRRGGRSSGRTHIEDTEPSAPRSDSPSPRALDPEAKSAYETALAQVQGKQLDKGLEGLNAFLARWPDHPYAENATYWRGEAFFAQGEYLRAGEQFEAVIARFGSGGVKAPDALLKLGLCQERLGASVRAREYWERLKTEYPRSDAARRIPAAGRDSLPKGPKENR